MKTLESIKIFTLQKPNCYFILKDRRVVYLGNVYQGIKSLALYFMGVNITLKEVQELEEIINKEPLEND